MTKFKLKERPFKDWIIDAYHAESPDGKYQFWIKNGFSFFRDDNRTQEQLLTLVNRWTRYKIWRELKKEMTLRISELIEIKILINNLQDKLSLYKQNKRIMTTIRLAFEIIGIISTIILTFSFVVATLIIWGERNK